MPPRKRLGQLLTELGVVDEHQLQSALGHQKQWGGKLGAVLVQKGFCKEADVVTALSKHLGMPSVKLADARVDARAVKFVSKQIAEKLHVFPYEVSGAGRSEVVTIAMSDPTDLSAVDQLAFHTGKRIKPMLAGDSEIVQAIHTHYADEKAAKPAAPAGAPSTASGPQRPVAAAASGGHPAVAPPPAAPATPAPAASSVSGEFPKRIGPTAATPAAGSPRVTPSAGSPYIPPPIPVLAPRPQQKLEEIDPGEAISAPPIPPKAPEPLDLPEDDGQMMGLEPIAAHSQFGDEVAGHEELEGAGSAGDAVEGLESAGVPHAGADEAAQLPDLEVPPEAPAAGDWGTDAASSEGWGAPAAASTDAPVADGWGETAAASPAEPAVSSDFGAAQDWSASSQESGEGWEAAPAAPAAESESAWGSDAGWSGEEQSAPADTAGLAADTAEAHHDAPGEELPMDAIIGTAEAAEGAPEAPAWGEEPAAAAPHEEHAAQEETHEEHAAQEETHEEHAAQEEAHEEHAAQEEAPHEEHTAQEEAPHEEHAAQEEAAHEDHAAQEEAPHEEHAAPEHEQAALEEPAHDQPAEGAAAAEQAIADSAEAPDAWGSSEDPLAASGETSAVGDVGQAWADAPPAEPLPSAEVSPSTDKFAPAPFAAETAAESAAVETSAPPEWGDAPAEEAHAAEEHPSEAPIQEDAASEDVSFEETPEEQPAESEFAQQGELKLEGWVAPPAEPEPQGAGWFGQALEATTPLSAADLGTLASVGIDPNDGVAALRLLAALVRVLNRRQLFELDEVANEVHESRAQAAAEHAAAEADANGVEAAPVEGAEAQPPADPVET